MLVSEFGLERKKVLAYNREIHLPPYLCLWFVWTFHGVLKWRAKQDPIEEACVQKKAWLMLSYCVGYLKSCMLQRIPAGDVVVPFTSPLQNLCFLYQGCPCGNLLFSFDLACLIVIFDQPTDLKQPAFILGVAVILRNISILCTILLVFTIHHWRMKSFCWMGNCGTVVVCWKAGWAIHPSSTFGMIHSQIYSISSDCLWPSIVL